MAAAIGGIALCVFGASIFAKSFADEYAYITQSFYADLFFTGQVNDKLWLEGFAADLQPLPKYLIGLALRAANLPMPTPRDASQWYADYHQFGTPATLAVARIPMIVLGAVGCVSLFGCGVLIKCWRVGALAAVLLMLNPLYSLHAHRAMSDVACEASVTTALCAALWAFKRFWSPSAALPAVLGTWIAGVCCGLALLSKLTGFLSLAVVVGWLGLAWLARGLTWPRKLAMTLLTMLTIATAVAVLVALNPYLTAHPHLTTYERGLLSKDGRVLLAENPWQRFQTQVALRTATSEYQQRRYSDDALTGIPDRVKVLFVQGLGRFGPLGPAESDSTIRFDLRQDWGLVLWAPLLLLGLVESIRLSRTQLALAEAPTAAALLIWVALAWMVLAVYLPMAWDRYLLPLQSGHALLGGLAIAAIWDRLRARQLKGARRG
jgi:4-amino-4-deoxy-L-arabinose transferase-like glycosyltransferase